MTPIWSNGTIHLMEVYRWHEHGALRAAQSYWALLWLPLVVFGPAAIYWKMRRTVFAWQYTPQHGAYTNSTHTHHSQWTQWHISTTENYYTTIHIPLLRSELKSEALSWAIEQCQSASTQTDFTLGRSLLRTHARAGRDNTVCAAGICIIKRKTELLLRVF